MSRPDVFGNLQPGDRYGFSPHMAQRFRFLGWGRSGKATRRTHLAALRDADDITTIEVVAVGHLDAAVYIDD